MSADGMRDPMTVGDREGLIFAGFGDEFSTVGALSAGTPTTKVFFEATVLSCGGATQVGWAAASCTELFSRVRDIWKSGSQLSAIGHISCFWASVV